MFQSVMIQQRLQFWTYERHTGFWQTRQKRMGQKFFVNTNVTEVITENGKIVGVKASSSNNEMVFRAKMVIDASGFQSVVSKSLGLVKQWKEVWCGSRIRSRS